MDFDAIITGIRKAIYGREVREYIASSMEWTRDFVNQSIANIKELLRQAEAARDAAKASQDAAKVSETNAKASENAAWASQNAAASSASAAAGSASAAKTSETNAKASENAAKISETNAKTSETNAKASEDVVKTSAANAKTSETNAKSSETKAATSAANAKTSETNAKASADSMGTSVATCTAKAKEAEASAGKAKTSEGNAKTSEGNAKASENEARQLVEAAKKVVNTDKTLTIDGAPADAKTVGDKFNSIKYAGSASAGGDATRALAVKDYAGSQTIEIGYASDGLTTSNLTHIAGYTDNGTKIKDVSKDVLKRWLGLGSAAYEENTIVRDVGDGRPLTFNYSADAVNYNDFTWVPVWIDGQMKTVNKNVFSTSGVQSSGSNYIRFGDGTQICWYSIKTEGSDYEWSFPVAFSNTEYSVVASPTPFLSYGCKDKTTTSCKVSVLNNSPCSGIAIGSWW